jgi:hypothetical protein
MSPFVQLSIRYLLGCATMLLIVAAQPSERAQFMQVWRDKKEWKILFLLGVLNNLGRRLFGSVATRKS